MGSFDFIISYFTAGTGLAFFIFNNFDFYNLASKSFLNFYAGSIIYFFKNGFTI
jgi:hypothetical protein